MVKPAGFPPSCSSMILALAWRSLKDIPLGEGFTLIGCGATQEAQGAKVNLWDSAFVLRGGRRSDELTQFQANGQTFDLLTAEFSAGPMLAPDSEAFPTSVAALADAPVLEQPRIIQVNRAVIQPPVRGDQLLTQDNRLYCQARLRDFTGGLDVEVVESAVPELFGLTSKDEVMEHVNAGTLKPILSRVNARGILKMANGTMKTYIAKISESPLGAKVSAEAMRLSVGLSSIAGDVVMAVPVDRVLDDPLVGLAVRADEAGTIRAYNVFLLVQGTSKTVVEPLGTDGQPLEAQSFRVKSENARCLLSGKEILVDLHGYCDYDTMLQYRLDKDYAVVLVSAWTHDPGSARPLATIESMVKIAHVKPVQDAMMEEWKAALTNDADTTAKRKAGAYESPQKAEYWERPVKKLRRMESEATP